MKNKGVINIWIIAFLMVGIIFNFLVLVSTLNLWVNKFNYEYLYGAFYVADSYVVRVLTSTSGKIIVKSVPYDSSGLSVDFGVVNLNGTLTEANVYTVDNNYKGLKFYIEYSQGLVNRYYQIDKVSVY